MFLRRFQTSFTLLVFVLTSLIVFSNSVHAEGSKELVSHGGHRALLDFTDTIQAGIHRRTYINVYVESGESLSVGSSANGIRNGQIVMNAPNGDVFTSDGTDGVGIIQDNVEEQAGPLPNENGYTPYTIEVTEETAGIWQIEFHGPVSSKSGGGSKFAADQAWTVEDDQPTNHAQVFAWDATVRNVDGEVVNGRAYTNAFAGNMRGNKRSFAAKFYVLTQAGWEYTIHNNSLDPFGFIYIANSKGNLNETGEWSAYQSAVEADASVADPEAPDTQWNVTHKMFFNPPAEDLPESSVSATQGGETWLRTPPPPPIISEFGFTGTEGTANQAGYAMGGNFNFESTAPGRFTIYVDVNDNGSGDDDVDLTFHGQMVEGENTVNWDGRNGLDEYVDHDIASHAVFIDGYYGEVHFPLYDSEGNPDGLILERTNGPNAPDFTVYWDDSAFGDTGNFEDGMSALDGIDSSTGVHMWNAKNGSKEGGDKRMIDTWAYVPSESVSIDQPIRILQTDLYVVSVDRSPSSITLGDTIRYTIKYSNNGPDAAPAAAIFAVLPEDLDNQAVVSCDTGVMSCEAVIEDGIIQSTVAIDMDQIITLVVEGDLLLRPDNDSVSMEVGILRGADSYDASATAIVLPNGPQVSYEAIQAQCTTESTLETCNNLAKDVIAEETVADQVAEEIVEEEKVDEVITDEEEVEVIVEEEVIEEITEEDTEEEVVEEELVEEEVVEDEEIEEEVEEEVVEEDPVTVVYEEPVRNSANSSSGGSSSSSDSPSILTYAELFEELQEEYVPPSEDEEVSVLTDDEVEALWERAPYYLEDLLYQSENPTYEENLAVLDPLPYNGAGDCQPIISNPELSVEEQTEEDLQRMKAFLNISGGEQMPLNGDYTLELRDALYRYQLQNPVRTISASGLSGASESADIYAMVSMNLDFCYMAERCPHFVDYIHIGDEDGTPNDLQPWKLTTQVDTWKEFLNVMFPGANLQTDGVFDESMYVYAGAYQLFYQNVILGVWNNANPRAVVTYYLRESSRNWANYLVRCPEGPVELYDGSGDVDYF